MTFIAHNATRVAAAVLAVTITLAAVLALFSPLYATDAPRTALPAAVMTMPAGDATRAETVLAGGCFWGMEMVFQHVRGVREVVSGYAGGSAHDATYARTSSGRTGHAEAVRIVFDPRQVSFAQILQVYFAVAHDPTQHNRQGPDVGPQYRSQIFAMNAAQQKVAAAYIRQLDATGVFARPIATRVSRLPADGFYPAEAWHQNYGRRHPDSLYIRLHDQPKVSALAARLPGLYRAEPVLAASP